MIALAVVLSVVVALLAVLVAGLLRSHADILRALHDLGVGVGDPATTGTAATPTPVPLTIGPPLPAERSTTTAPTVSGSTPGGDALAVAVAGTGGLTLLAFLSSGCATCAGFWNALRRPDGPGLPGNTRLVVVTKGPDTEIPAEVASRAAPHLTVIMSTDAWRDYEVPGSPFFVLVDGPSGRRIGEGVARHIDQVVDLVRRAEVDNSPVPPPAADTHGSGGASASRAQASGLDGPERERANDRELAAAGILPGDPSLYPSSLEDLYGPAGHRRSDVATDGTAARTG